MPVGGSASLANRIRMMSEGNRGAYQFDGLSVDDRHGPRWLAMPSNPDRQAAEALTLRKRPARVGIGGYVSKQLGHKNIATTIKTYALYIDGAKLEADRVRERRRSPPRPVSTRPGGG
jgi:integrase